MKITDEVLLSLGAKRDAERGGLVIDEVRFRAVFLRSPDGDAWDVRVSPIPDRLGTRAYLVVNVVDLLHALFWTGRAVGEEDLRRKFRDLMELAESDTGGEE